MSDSHALPIPEPAAPAAPANPLMHPAKEQRILIWRTEVASALSLDSSSSSAASSSSSRSDDLIADSAFNLDNNYSSPNPHGRSNSYSAFYPHDGRSAPGPASSRPRSLWKRISWRLVPRARRSVDNSRLSTVDPSLPPERTVMYRDLAAPTAAGAAGQPDDKGDDAVDVLADEDSQGAAGVLRDKQERLSRAARLLNQGVRTSEGATAVQARRTHTAPAS